MRRTTLLLSLSLLASAYAGQQAAVAQPYQRPPPPPPPYAGNQATSPENCGTPDEPKPCPPMPRVPLQSYPGNRQ